MKQLKEVLPGILMVKVPKGIDISKIHVIVADKDYNLLLKNEHGTNDFLGLLPAADSYEIVSLVSECSEEVARGIVMNEYGDMFDYTNDFAFCSTAIESLKSLALSNGFTETDLIIKKIEK